MNCPQCHEPTRVRRTTKLDGMVKRRRFCERPECPSGGYTFESIETIIDGDQIPGWSVAKLPSASGSVRTEPFSFDKVKEAVTRALRYSDASIAELAPDIAGEILGEVHAYVASETDARTAATVCVPSSLIGQLLYQSVRRRDEMAAIFFATSFMGRVAEPRHHGTSPMRTVDDVLEFMVRERFISHRPEFSGSRQPIEVIPVERNLGRHLGAVTDDRHPTSTFKRKKLVDGFCVALRGRGTHDQVHRWANILTDQVVEQIADTPRVSTSHLVSASLHTIAELSSIGWLRYRFVRAAMSSPDQLALEIVAYQHRHRGELPLLDREDDDLDPPNVA